MSLATLNIPDSLYICLSAFLGLGDFFLSTLNPVPLMWGCRRFSLTQILEKFLLQNLTQTYLTQRDLTLILEELF